MKFRRPQLWGPLWRVLLVFIWMVPSYGGIISYYRFEVDNDASATGLSTPDEIAGGTPLISSTARLDSSANPGSLPNSIIPSTGQPNSSSLDGDPLDINASAAYNAALDVSSITVELWTRTEESTAVIISRSTTSTVNGISNGLADGFRIYDPSSLKIQYYVTDGVTTQLRQINTGVGTDNVGSRGDGNTNWRHLAFSFEATTGEGTFYLDGQVIGTDSLNSSNYVMYWGGVGAQPVLQVGVQMDGYNFSKTQFDNGFIDEIRFSDNALEEEELLITPVPEPGTIAGGILLLLLAGWSRRQRILGWVQAKIRC